MDDVAAANPDVVAAMVARVKFLGDAANGYKAPQFNVPIDKEAKPGPDNNYTWAPFQT